MSEDKYGIGNHHFSDEEIAEMMSPALAQKKMQEAKYKEFLSQILSGDVEDNAGPYEMRCIVERDDWFIPIKADGRFQILNVKKGEFARLYAAISKKDGRRTNRQGRGGQLLPIYQEIPENANASEFAKLDGRQLARSLPSGISGILVERDLEEPLRELDSEHFDALKALAEAVEVEDALIANGALKTAPILNYKFRVAIYQGHFWRHNELASVCTAEDKQYFSDECNVVEMTGRELFTKLLADGSYAGVVVNPAYDIGRNGKEIKGLLLSMSFMERALKQAESELRVPQYIARSQEEFEEWLLQVYFPKPYQIVEEKNERGSSLIYAIAKGSALEWNERECEFSERKSQVETPRFELRPAASSSPDELAAGKSTILCPAKLAQNLFLQLPERNRRDFIWAPGRGFGLGRVLSAKDVAASQRRAKLATELLKLIPVGSESIPASSMLSTDGAAFLQQVPQIGKRAWAENALQQAKRYCKTFILG
ncbi:MAG: hypothetical protein K2X77_26205 [Candidatus Obscuribacterales bacterium]|nr:hypothetical protein [Candidatus Obscuribacterales bacterium]